MKRFFKITLLFMLYFLAISCGDTQTAKDVYSKESSVATSFPPEIVASYDRVIIRIPIERFFYESAYYIEIYRFGESSDTMLVETISLENWNGSAYVHSDTTVIKGDYSYFYFLKDLDTRAVISRSENVVISYTASIQTPFLYVNQYESGIVKISSTLLSPVLSKSISTSYDIELYRSVDNSSFTVVDTLQINATTRDSILYDTLDLDAQFFYKARFQFGDSLTSDFGNVDSLVMDAIPDTPQIDTVVNEGKRIRVKFSELDRYFVLYRYSVENAEPVAVDTFSRSSSYSDSDSGVLYDVPDTAGIYYYFGRNVSWTSVGSGNTDTLAVYYRKRLLAPAVAIQMQENTVTITASESNYSETHGVYFLFGISATDLEIVDSSWAYSMTHTTELHLSAAGTYYLAVIPLDQDKNHGDTSDVIFIDYDGTITPNEDFVLEEKSLDIICNDTNVNLWRSESKNGPFTPLNHYADTTVYEKPKGRYFYKVSRVLGGLESDTSRTSFFVDYKGLIEAPRMAYPVRASKDKIRVVSQRKYYPDAKKYRYIIEESVNNSSFTPICTVDALKTVETILDRSDHGTYQYQLRLLSGLQVGDPSEVTDRAIVELPGKSDVYSIISSPEPGATYTRGATLNWDDLENQKSVWVTFWKGDTKIKYELDYSRQASNGTFYNFDPKWGAGDDYRISLSVYFKDNTPAQIYFSDYFSYRPE